MLRMPTLAAITAVSMSFAGLAHAQHAEHHAAATAAHIAAAIADTGRPEADVKRDADRKPAEMLAFAGVQPGSEVADFIPGGGYFTRLFSKAVGPNGKVYAVTNPPPVNATQPPPIQAVASDPQYGNVQLVAMSLGAFKLPEQVDVFWTAQNYHDLYLTRFNLDLPAVNKAIYDAVKPGGVLIVVDHTAHPGADVVQSANTVHRIDPASVRRTVEAAGFRFEGESKALANPSDDHAKNVFDPTIRGKTDQFVYKFRKPN